jgi:hypothetical protein
MFPVAPLVIEKFVPGFGFDSPSPTLVLTPHPFVAGEDAELHGLGVPAPQLKTFDAPEPESVPESGPDPESGPGPLSTLPSTPPSGVAEELPQPARTPVATRTTYGEIWVNHLAMAPLHRAYLATSVSRETRMPNRSGSPFVQLDQRRHVWRCSVRRDAVRVGCSQAHRIVARMNHRLLVPSIVFAIGCGGSSLPPPQSTQSTVTPSTATTSESSDASASPAKSTKTVPVGELVMDAPLGATVEKRGDGHEVAAPPRFRVFVKPAITTDVSHDDLTKPGWGISELKEEQHEPTIRLYRAKRRNKTSWFVDVLVDVGSDTYECATTQSIVDSEAFTHEDVDAMLVACRTLRAKQPEE